MIYKNKVINLSSLCIGIFLINIACERIRKPYKKAEDFLLYDLNGRRFYLSAQKGRIVLLNFWAVQCAPCIKEMPQLEQIGQYFHDKDGMVIGICSKTFEVTLLKSIIEKNKISYRNCIDVNNKITNIYDVNMLPTTFIIDYNGFVRYKTVGYKSENAENYKKIILQLINERDKKKQ